MSIICLVCMVFAFVFLVLAAIRTPEPPRLVFGWMGLAFWALSILLGSLGGRL